MGRFILNLLFTRAALIRTMFSSYENTAIVNALWRRSKDTKAPDGSIDTTVEGDAIRKKCEDLAIELGK